LLDLRHLSNRIGYNLILDCGYKEKNKAKSVAGRKWHDKLKVWRYPLEYQTYKDLDRNFPNLVKTKSVKKWAENVLKNKAERVGMKHKPPAEIEVEVYKGDKLYDYQKQGVWYLTNVDRAILADDMGAGKSIQSIMTCELMDVNKVLIVVPNSLKYTWQGELCKWIESPGVIVIEGGRGKRKEQITKFHSSGTKYLIVNYATVRNYPQLADYKYDAIIFDEGHKLKNDDTQQTQASKKLKADRLHILTGTPMLNKPDELWSLLNLLYPKHFSSYWRFVYQYCDVEETHFGVDINGLNEDRTDDLIELLEPVMIRRKKEDILPELPDKVYHTRYIEMGDKQAKIYKQMEDDMWVMLDNQQTVAAPVLLAQLMRLRQIAISPVLVGAEGEQANSTKIDELMNIVEDNVDKTDITVFTQFVGAAELVCRRLDKAGVGHTIITGEVDTEKRSNNSEKFQEDNNCKVMVATIEAAAHGYTWTNSGLAIFLDKHWTPAINTQAEDRLHRIGQENSVNVISLVVKDTIEERMEYVLGQKQKDFDLIINQTNEISSKDIIKMLREGI